MKTRSRVAVAALLTAGALGSIGCSESPGEGASDSPSPTPVPLRVDGQEVAQVSLATGASARPLASYLSGPAANPEAWTHLQAHGANGQRFGIHHPARHYPNAEVRVFRDESGALSIGVFPLPAAGGGRGGAPNDHEVPVLALGDVADVEIFLEEAPASPPSPDTPTPIRLRVDGAEVPETFTEEELAALPHTDEGESSSAAWALGDLLRAKLGDRTVGTVELVLADGTTEHLGPALRANPQKRVMIERDARGALRCAIYAVGGPDEPTHPSPERIIGPLARIDVHTRAGD